MTVPSGEIIAPLGKSTNTHTRKDAVRLSTYLPSRCSRTHSSQRAMACGNLLSLKW